MSKRVKATLVPSTEKEALRAHAERREVPLGLTGVAARECSYFLLFRDGPEAGSLHPLGSEVQMIGRSASCTMCVLDPSISRIHCAIWRGVDTVWVRDLGSTNGTFVNEKAVRYARLKGGDQIRLGKRSFELVEC
jgi:hypothetical protein